MTFPEVLKNAIPAGGVNPLLYKKLVPLGEMGEMGEIREIREMGEMREMGRLFVVTTSVVTALLGSCQVTRSFGGRTYADFENPP